MNRKTKSNLIKKKGSIWSRFLVVKKDKSQNLNIKELQAVLKKNGFSSSYSYILKLIKEKKIQGKKVNRSWQFDRKYVDKLIKENKQANIFSKLFRKVFPKKEPSKKEIILPLYFGWGIKVAVDKFEEKIVTPFKNKYQFAGTFLIVGFILIGVVMFVTTNIIIGETYNWVQSNWVGGADTSNYPLHPTNGTNWTKYYSAEAGLNTGVSNEVTITPVGTVPAKTATLPNGKYDAPVVYYPTGDKFYSIGGYYLADTTNNSTYLNEIVQYDPNADSTTTSGMAVLPVALRGHAAAYNPDDGDIYIFGGHTGSAYNLNIYKYDVDTQSVSDTGYDISTQGRIYSSVAYAEDENMFYLFGGYYLDAVDGPYNPKYTDEIIEFDYTDGSKTVYTDGSLPAISGTSAVYYPIDQDIYIFGGYDSTAVDYSDTIYVFDPSSPSSGASDTGHNLYAEGANSKRAYTAASYYDSFGDGAVDKMYIFGGYKHTEASEGVGGTSIYFDDVLMYDTTGNTTDLGEDLAKQLKGASAALDTTDGQIYIFGGYNGNDSEFSDAIYNYKLYSGPLTSSPYNTTDSSAVIGALAWTENTPAGSTILFQMRTTTNSDPEATPADSTDDIPNAANWTDWCGPDNGGAGCSTTTYFTNPAGTEAIDDIFKDGGAPQADQWIQYRAYLVSDRLEATNLELTATNITYVINVEPEVTLTTASQADGQSADGDVDITYKISDADDTSATVYVFYDIGVTLNGGINATDTTITLSDGTYFPTQGSVLIDNEIISYSNKSGNDLTVTGRGASNTVFYKTSHTSSTSVWVLATDVTGDVGGGVVVTEDAVSKSITWDPSDEPYGALADYFAASTAKVKVVANDGNAARQIHSDPTDTAFELDVKPPVAGATGAGATGMDINGNTLTSLGNDKVNAIDPTVNLSATDDNTFYYYQSYDGTFDDETSAAYSSSVTGDLGTLCADQEYGCVKTVYVKFEDDYDNENTNSGNFFTDTVTLDTNAPLTPGDIFIQDVSNPDATPSAEWRLFISWDKKTESDWIRYEIQRSTDGVNYSAHPTVPTITDSDLNYLLDSDLTYGDTYYYNVRSVDDILNASDWAGISHEAGGNPNDIAAPRIENITESDVTTSTITIEWTTSEPATSTVVYHTTDTEVGVGSSTQGVSGYSTSHKVILEGLDHSDLIYYKVRSADASDNSGDSAVGDFTTLTPDDTPPNVQSVTVTSITEDSAAIGWTSTEAGNSFVEFSESDGFANGSGDIQGSFDYVNSHEVVLRGLDPSTTYYYKIRSSDIDGNLKIDDQRTFSTLVSGSDVTGPEITNVSATNIEYNTARIIWDTSGEASNSFVEFGGTNEYGRMYGQNEFVTSHIVELPLDLIPATTYHYKVWSADAAGNWEPSTDNTFQTSVSPNDVTDPVIENVTIGEPGTTSVNIQWDTTAEVSDSYIGYSEQEDYYNIEQGSPLMVTSHSVDLVGLDPGTTYYFQVKSKDPTGNLDTETSSSFHFTTVSSGSNKPVIDNIEKIEIGSDEVTIIWTTDVAATSFVEYGYDAGAYLDTQGQYDSVTSHSVTLKALVPEQIYHFRVRSTGTSSGLEDVSLDHSFNTLPSTDVEPPIISAISSGDPAYTTATITWSTHENSDSIVLYGIATDALNYVAGNNTDSTMSHSVNLIDLSAGTTYYYQVQSRDSSGNTQTDNNSGAYHSFATDADTTGPTIETVAHPVVDRNSATITWTTTESSTSQVEYGEESDLDGSSLTTEVTDLRTEHSVIVSGLTSGTQYYYRPKSKDSSDNSSPYSTISTFTTAATSEDSTAPAITGTSHSGTVTMTGATITWNTSGEAGNSIVDYGTSDSLGYIEGDMDESVTSHSVTLSGLTPEILYYYQVRTQDAAGNSDPDDNSGNYYTFTTLGDTTPPTLSVAPTEDVIADTSASIVWTTNEDSTTQIYYGATPAFGSQTTLDSNLTKIHSAYITGLTAETKYYYWIESKDADGNTLQSDNNYSFTTVEASGQVVVARRIYVQPTVTTDTAAPSIDNITVDSVARSQATITWNSSEDATSLIEYGTDDTYGSIAGDYNADDRDHEVKLSNLFSGSKYYFRVISQDGSGNKTVSEQYDFATETALVDTDGVEVEEQQLIEQVVSIFEKFTNPYSFASVSQALEEMAQRIISAPLIASDYPIITPGENSVEISWITDKKANSLIGYVPADQYVPGSDNPYLITAGNADEQVTSHKVTITGLISDELYHFVIKSKPEVGPEAISEDTTFRTKSVRPEIINLRLASRTEDSAVFAWDTNILTRSNLEYTNLATTETLTQGEVIFKKRHEFELQNLNHGTSYELDLEVTDEYGNVVVSPTVNFTTSADQVEPEILQVNTDSTLYPGKTTKIQTIISWKSNEPAKGQVFWQEGIAEGVTVTAEKQEDIYGVNHIAVITKFKPATVYKFWIEAEDAFGNKAKSKNFTVLTPEKTETVFEMIVDNLQETFGWTQMFK